MLNDGALQRWALAYKQCLNDPDIRQRLSDRHDPLGYLEISDGNTVLYDWVRDIGERGTVELKYLDGSGHYLSYFKEGDGWKIFDPSRGTGSGFRPLTFWSVGLKAAFGQGKYTWFKSTHPFQFMNYDLRRPESDDTWCQSWSLAMIHPYLQRDVLGWAEQPDASLYSRRNQAQQIVKYFAMQLRQSDMLALGLDWDLHQRVMNEDVLDRAWTKFYYDAATPVTPRGPSSRLPGNVRRGRLRRNLESSFDAAP